MSGMGGKRTLDKFNAVWLHGHHMKTYVTGNDDEVSPIDVIDASVARNNPVKPPGIAHFK